MTEVYQLSRKRRYTYEKPETFIMEKLYKKPPTKGLKTLTPSLS